MENTSLLSSYHQAAGSLINARELSFGEGNKKGWPIIKATMKKATEHEAKLFDPVRLS
jgi:hypothetical protein